MNVRPRPPRGRQRQEPEPYQRYRQPLQRKWRPLILARDGARCRVCRAKPHDASLLDMAHITDCVAFVRAAADHRAVTFSYRWDNLYILCRSCHRASHRFRLRDDELDRRRAVEEMEADLRRLRGWSSPFAVLPPQMVPSAWRSRRSFHDRLRISPLVPFPTFPKYAADGGLVFADEEMGPKQGTLDTAGTTQAPGTTPPASRPDSRTARRDASAARPRSSAPRGDASAGRPGPSGDAATDARGPMTEASPT